MELPDWRWWQWLLFAIAFGILSGIGRAIGQEISRGWFG